MLFRCADAFGFLKAADYKQSIKIIEYRWKFTAGCAILNLNTCSRGGIPRKIKESDRSGLYGCKSNCIADDARRESRALLGQEFLAPANAGAHSVQALYCN